MRLICIGKLKEVYLKQAVNEYFKSINKKNRLEIVEINDEKIPDNPSDKEMDNIKELEGKKILEKINREDFVINLCINGKQIDTEKFIDKIKKIDKEVVFVIGGSLGLSEKVLRRGNYDLSFSSMTFPHQLMRVILLEQINRI